MRLSQIARAAGVIMQNFLMLGLHSQSGLVRKGSAFLLRAPKRLARRRAQPADYASSPPVLVNSIPKSGTHLLDQIIGAIPSTRNYGEFISSMTSSFRFQRQTPEHTCRCLQGAVPSELVRAHLFYSEDVATTLQGMSFVHFLIYRDPRDVVVSEAIYYRRINRWHRLHAMFRDAASDGEAILMAIRGVSEESPGLYFPDVGARLDHYLPWINQPAVHAIRFEDLVSDGRIARIRDLMAFYAASTHVSAAIDDLCTRAIAAIAPAKSHTYRSGKSGGWRNAFTDEHREAFKQVASRQLISLGYETDEAW